MIMGKINLFTIELDYTPGVYHPGQWVQGKVILDLAEQFKMRGIHIVFYGLADVHWTYSFDWKILSYDASEPYFHQSVCLFGKPLGEKRGDNPVVQAGRYHYPFQFLLPPNLPSSYESWTGRVMYRLVATIDRPWVSNKTYFRPFTVVSNLDLNTDPAARMPFEGNNDKMIRCLCFASGPITAMMKMDRSGYVPGEYISLGAQVENHSNRRIKSSKVMLEQRVYYHSSKETQYVTKSVVWEDWGEIPPHGSKSNMGVSLLIPPLPPSYLTGCGIIDIHYFLKLIVEPAGPAKDLEVSHEVIIGTIPLQNVNTLFEQAADAASCHTVQHSASPPPPSYRRSVFGMLTFSEADDAEDALDDTSWSPTYTYYTHDTKEQVPSVGFTYN